MAQIQIQKALTQTQKSLQGSQCQSLSTQSRCSSQSNVSEESDRKRNETRVRVSGVLRVSSPIAIDRLSYSNLSKNAYSIGRTRSIVKNNNTNSTISNHKVDGIISKADKACSRPLEAVITNTSMKIQGTKESSLVNLLRNSTRAIISQASTMQLFGFPCSNSYHQHHDRATIVRKRQNSQSVGNTFSRSRRKSIFVTLFILGALTSTLIPTMASAQMVEERKGPDGYRRLENIDGVAFNPLRPITDQLLIPVVAGAPSPSSSFSAFSLAKDHPKERQTYRERLEADRSKHKGSFYVELTPLERKLDDAASESGLSGYIRYSKEPLPWEGVDVEDVDETSNENGIDNDDVESLGWSYSPWGGDVRYEILPDRDDENGVDYLGDGDDLSYYNEEVDKTTGQGLRQKMRLVAPQQDRHHQQQKDESSMMTVDNDDGSEVVEEQDSRFQLSTSPSQSSPFHDQGKVANFNPPEVAQTMEETHTLKIEGPGESDDVGTNQEPNVMDTVKEITDSHVWDAESVAQSPARDTQEYIELSLSGPPVTMEPNAAGKGGRLFADEPQSSLDTLNGNIMTETVETEMMRPKLDQIDLLGHEAEIDWLQEQNDIQHAWKMKHHRQYREKNVNSEDEHDNHMKEELGYYEEEEDYNVDEEESADEEIVEWGSEDDESRADSERPFKANSFDNHLENPDWYKKHGGMNPKHIFPNRRFRSKSEKQDRDPDGTVFPELYSDDPYSAIVYPTVSSDPYSPLGYVAYNEQGDRIMDFSMVGWNEGNTDLPDPVKDVPILETLSPRYGAEGDSDTGDDTDRIQHALDRVSRRTTMSVVQNQTVVPTGALVLEKGLYRIKRPLRIRNSGILFRGDPEGGSRIVCMWEPTGPRYAIEIEGKSDEVLEDTRVPIVGDYIPVGSFYIPLDPVFLDDSELAVGDEIILTRVGNNKWVEDIGMDEFDSDKKGVKPWKRMRAHMYRTIRAIDPQTGIVQLDAPLPISIRRQYGGGWVTKYVDNKIRAIGFQFLDMVFPNNIDRTIEDMLDEKGRGSEDYRFSYEIFANYALRLDQVAHVYVSHITTAFFHNFISVGTDVHHLTIDSVVHSYPDDMLSGQSAFQLSGQLVLIKNSLSQGSFHFFVDISHVMGPNVVHRAQATNIGKPYEPLPLDFAPGEVGPHMKFCTGLLFDQVVTDGTIMIVNRGDMGTGQGYSGANSVIWNSRAREGVLTHRANGFQNFIIGSEDYDAEDRRPWDSHGWKEHLGSEVLPGSLYLRQLADRLERQSKGWVS